MNYSVYRHEVDMFMEISCALNQLQGAESLKGQQFLTHARNHGT
jgi:hypothetical protein